MPGSFDACIEAIKALKRYGIIMRVATSVTPDNVGQLREIFHIIKSSGVNAFAVSPVSEFGRGNDINNAEQQHLLIHKINEELGEFSNDPLLFANRPVSKPRNCGAGSRTYAVNYKGDVRSCLYLVDAVSFGNVRSSDYQKVFGQDVMFNFFDAPSPGGDECVGCKYLPVCTGCFAKAFRISEKKYPECPWRKKWFPNITLNFNDSSCGSIAGCGSSLYEVNNDLITIRSVRK